MNETYVTVQRTIRGRPSRARDRRERALRDVPGGVERCAGRDFKTGEYDGRGNQLLNVTAFRALGVNLANSLVKGQPVLVYGRMRINQWVNGDGAGPPWRSRPTPSATT